MHGLCTAFALWCLVINSREISACIATERDALIAFNATIGDPEGRLNSWQGEGLGTLSSPVPVAERRFLGRYQPLHLAAAGSAISSPSVGRFDGGRMGESRSAACT